MLSPLRDDDVADVLFRANAIVVARNDVDGEIIWSTASAETLFGIRQIGGIIGMSVDEFVPKEHREKHAEYRMAYAKDPQVRRMGALRNVEAERADGSRFPAAVKLIPCVLSVGECVLVEISEIQEPQEIHL